MNKINQKEIDYILTLYIENKKSIKEISKIICISTKNVSKILKRYALIIKEGNNTGNKKYKINENYFNQIDTPEKAYILGLLYADGNLQNARQNKVYRTRITLQEADKHILEKINFLMENNKPLKFNKKNKPTQQNTYEISIINKQITNDLYLYGLIPNKTFKVTFPTFLTDNLTPHFIRGYFDGDGCIHISKKTNSYCNILGTENFCKSVQNILKLEINLETNINKIGKIYNLTIKNIKGIYKFYDYLYQNETSSIHLIRKYDKFQEFFEMRKEIDKNMEIKNNKFKQRDDLIIKLYTIENKTIEEIKNISKAGTMQIYNALKKHNILLRYNKE